MTHEIQMQLDLLAERRAELTALSSRKSDARAAIIPPDVKVRMDQIDGDYDNRIEELKESITQLTNQIKNSVMEHGSNVVGKRLKAVPVAGVTKWDTTGLNGYAVARPEILAFRTVGKPFVRVEKC